MVSLLRSRGIRDERVLDAMSKVPREIFVPKKIRKEAYYDGPLDIGHGQTISQPYMVALIIEALDLEGSEKVLEIGTGSGYSAAILSYLAGEVVSIERHRDLAREAKDRLDKMGVRNARVYVGDGSLGWVYDAPYDAIAFHAGSPHLPKELFSQLRGHGRIVAPVAAAGGGEELLRAYVGPDGRQQIDHLGYCRFVPLIGERGHKEVAPI